MAQRPSDAGPEADATHAPSSDRPPAEPFAETMTRVPREVLDRVAASRGVLIRAALVESAARAIPLAGGASLVVAGLWWALAGAVQPSDQLQAWIAPSAVAMAFALVIGLSLARRARRLPSSLTAAIELDAAADTRSAFASSLELAGTRDRGAFEDWALRVAAEQARRTDLAPPPTPSLRTFARPAGIGHALLAAAVAFSLVASPRSWSEATAAPPAAEAFDLAEVQAAQEAIESVRTRIHDATGGQTAQADDDFFDSLEAELEEGLRDPDEALARAAERLDELADEADTEAERADATRDTAAESLAELEPEEFQSARDLADALADGDFNRAAQEAAALENQADDPSTQDELRSLADQLDRAADRAADRPDAEAIEGDLRDIADQLREQADTPPPPPADPLPSQSTPDTAPDPLTNPQTDPPADDEPREDQPRAPQTNEPPPAAPEQTPDSNEPQTDRNDQTDRQPETEQQQTDDQTDDQPNEQDQQGQQEPGSDQGSSENQEDEAQEDSEQPDRSAPRERPTEAPSGGDQEGQEPRPEDPQPDQPGEQPDAAPEQSPPADPSPQDQAPQDQPAPPDQQPPPEQQPGDQPEPDPNDSGDADNNPDSPGESAPRPGAPNPAQPGSNQPDPDAPPSPGNPDQPGPGADPTNPGGNPAPGDSDGPPSPGGQGDGVDDTEPATPRALDRLAEQQRRAEDLRRLADDLRDSSDRLLDPDADPNDAEPLIPGDGEGPLPGADPWSGPTELVDARDDAPSAGEPERVVSEWFRDPEGRPVEAGAPSSAPDVMRRAAGDAERAIEQQAVPRRHEDLIRRVFRRYAERAGDAARSAADADASSDPAPARDASDASDAD
ncbi:MAG: hypothetical protein AAFR96_04500 [Planctomycetota bacterium]